mgnify:FL=1
MAAIRNTYLKDYGISGEEYSKLIKFCRNATDEEKTIILQVANEVYSSISIPLYKNLTTGLGYDRLSKEEPIRMQRKDFQGYRRKCLKMIHDFLKQRR